MRKLLFLAVVALAWSAPHATSEAWAQQQYGDGYEANRITLVSLVNQFRQANGLNRLVISPALSASAQSYATYLRDTNQYGHAIGQSTEARAASHGWAGTGISENLTYAGDAYSAFRSWEREGPVAWPEYNHYTIMLDSGLTHIGVGIDHNIYVLNLGSCTSFCDGNETGPIVPPAQLPRALRSPYLSVAKPFVAKRTVRFEVSVHTDAATKHIKVVITGPKKYKKIVKPISSKYGLYTYRLKLRRRGRYFVTAYYPGDATWKSEKTTRRPFRVS